MRKWWIAPMVAALALSFAGCRQPQNEDSPFSVERQENPNAEGAPAFPTPTPEPRATAPVPESEASGTPRLITTPGEIRAVQGNEVVMQTAENDVVAFQVTPDTAIRIEGPEGIAVGVDALQPGMMVRASWRDQNGQKVAERIDLTGLENPPGSSPYKQAPPGMR